MNKPRLHLHLKFKSEKFIFSRLFLFPFKPFPNSYIKEATNKFINNIYQPFNLTIMRTLKFVFAAFTIVMAFVLTTSCEKEKTSQISDELLASAEDELMASSMEADIFEQVDGALTGEFDGKKSELDDVCYVKTVEFFNDGSRRITLDFGDGCEGTNGNVRSGKIIINVSGTWREANFVRVITFDNYFINDHQIEGTKTVRTQARNGAGNLSFTVVVDGFKITAPDGIVIERNSTRTREWIEGEGSGTRLDNVFEITGSASGVRANGIVYSMNITTALNVAVACPWTRSGVKEFIVDGNTATIDYGTGDCDNTATLTVNGESREITIRRRRR